MNSQSDRRDVKIRVTGDFASDHNIYLRSTDCEISTAEQKSRYHCMLGGAVIVHDLLTGVSERLGKLPAAVETRTLTVGFGGNDADNRPTGYPAAGVWSPKPSGSLLRKHGAKVWRLESSLGLGEAVDPTCRRRLLRAQVGATHGGSSGNE